MFTPTCEGPCVFVGARYIVPFSANWLPFRSAGVSFTLRRLEGPASCCFVGAQHAASPSRQPPTRVIPPALLAPSFEGSAAEGNPVAAPARGKRA